ncbi:MAG: IS91 family transposase [Deltaproteobacteria bacterium]|nr:IS91 family transposase [Deltaproteobacteria bacterium]MBW1959701.1 IS91 family transposase [Deltaproteobacteria bacterium]
MEMASVINQYYDAFMIKYGDTALPGHLKAMNAIRSCRTPDSGELYMQCTDCHHAEWRPLSCGHRSCPQCQNHEASRWIDRQQGKLLPVAYFLATFTLPYELRSLSWHHQKVVFSILFICVSITLKDFGLNPKNLGAEIGMTMVLHTHSRRLDFHPHMHVVVPGGGVDRRRRQWKKKKGKYLFNNKAMAKVFRARFLAALNEAGLSIPKRVPKEWVVDCKHVGKGITALKYLSKYLYRGVISEKNIISNQNGRVTFKYIESSTGNTLYRTLKGEDFLHLIMQHVLPKGFRRVRDYGFLHGNAKKLLSLVQLILHVMIKGIGLRPRPVFKCPCCKSPMVILGFRQAVFKSG